MTRISLQEMSEKIISQLELGELRQRLTSRTIVLATGCFDLVHPGHLHFLAEASLMADILVVGVNDDASVRLLKGPTRPVVTIYDRLRVLSAFAMVDRVFAYPETCAGASIGFLKPDIFAVGEDGWGDYPFELQRAKENDVKIQTIQRVASPSTTRMIYDATQHN